MQDKEEVQVGDMVEYLYGTIDKWKRGLVTKVFLTSSLQHQACDVYWFHLKLVIRVNTRAVGKVG
jgi:hypothetical protein